MYDKKTIIVIYFSDLPIVKLEFGKSLNTEDIKEGDDAYFECHIEARPEITKIQWFHNVSRTFRCITSPFTRSNYYHSCFRTHAISYGLVRLVA